jgi:hypothetical protein
MFNITLAGFPALIVSAALLAAANVKSVADAGGGGGGGAASLVSSKIGLKLTFTTPFVGTADVAP